MKVLHIQKVKGMGGSERHLLTLLPGLCSRGVQIKMLILTAENFDRFMADADALGLETAALPAGRDLSPSLSWRIAKQIKGFRPDIIHTHLIHGDVYGQTAARLARVPGVISMHSVHSFYGREPVRSVVRVAGRSARRVIAISDYVAGHIAAHGLAPATNVRVVPYGIDVDLWAVDPATRDDARGSIQLDQSGLVIGMASNLIPGKGHDVALDAFTSIKKQVPDASLVFAGDGPLREELLRGAEDRGVAGDVRALGYVKDVRGFMAACDVLLFPTQPSLGEGFGLAALEAMASGTPVIASRMGPLPELIEHGRTGLLVEPGDSSQLATAIIDLISDRGSCRMMGAAARRRAQDLFSVDLMVERTISVYEEVLA